MQQLNNKKVIAFDLDDTICYRDTSDESINKYLQCKPVPEMVEIVNECYESGFEVIIYTARGMLFLDGNRDNIYHYLYDLTREQLDKWGVKYHKVVLGKIFYDILVDDKVLTTDRVKSTEDIKRFLYKEDSARK